MSDQAAIVARIAEALARLRYRSFADMPPEVKPEVRHAAEAVADALGLPAILSIVEERRNAHERCSPKEAGRAGQFWCICCKHAWPCDDRKALDKIHNHLTGGAE